MSKAGCYYSAFLITSAIFSSKSVNYLPLGEDPSGLIYNLIFDYKERNSQIINGLNFSKYYFNYDSENQVENMINYITSKLI